MGTRRKLTIESQVIDTHELIGKRKTAFQKHTILKRMLGKGLFPNISFKSHCILGRVYIGSPWLVGIWMEQVAVKLVGSESAHV